jgi:uncharacterized protein YbjT (DUF2867 family)
MTDFRQRRVLVAGATGATGRTLLRLAGAQGMPVTPLVRPKSAGKLAGAVVADLVDREALIQALRGHTTVIQLIGTMRRRFSTGDTYEASDVGTTRQLIEASREAGVDHVVLLSSVGAGRPVGAYLQAKATAERIVTESEIDYTIVRPSMFVGEEHQPPSVVVALGRRFAPVAYRPIMLDELASILLGVALRRSPVRAVLEGPSLWQQLSETV